MFHIVTPPTTIRILGQPWTIELTDLPNDDDEGGSWSVIPHEALIRVRDDSNHTVLASNIFETIVSRALHMLADGERKEYVINSSFSDALYGTLRSNPAVLSYCAGWQDEVPSSVTVCGFVWAIKCVHHAPGCDRTTHGVASWQDQSIYLREDLPIDTLRSTLLHELCHAVATIANRPLNDDEAAIRVIHYTLYDFFCYNAEATRWLFGIEEANERGTQ